MRLHDDRGATIVIVAACLLVLMGVAAVVADLGLGFNERRLDQTSVDNAAIAGALFTALSGQPATGGGEAQTVVDENLNRTLTAADWSNCVDPDKLSNEPIAGVECVSYEIGYKSFTFRVQLPTQDVDATFGRVLGATVISTQAEAEATVAQSDIGDILPFGLLFGSGPGDEACLKDDSLSLPPPCDGPDLGQFGPYDVYKYEPGPGDCSSTNNVFVYSAALGVDHNMSSFNNTWDPVMPPAEPPEQIEGCDAGVPRLFPNTVEGDTGNKIPLLATAFFSGDTLFGVTFDGRLEDVGSGLTWDPTPGPTEWDVETIPLWDYFDTSQGYAATCRTNVLAELPDLTAAKAELLNCLSSWSTIDGHLFTGLESSPRFAFVPEYDEDAYSPSGTYHIQLFRPVFLQTLYIYESAGSYTEMVPGMTGTVTGNNLRAMTSIVLDCRWLDVPCDEETGTTSTDPAVFDLNTLRLSK